MSARVSSLVYKIERDNGGTLSPYGLEYLLRQLKLKSVVTVSFAYTLLCRNIRKHGQIGLRVSRLSPGSLLEERKLINKVLKEAHYEKPRPLKARLKRDPMAYWDPKKRAMHLDVVEAASRAAAKQKKQKVL